MDGEPNQEGVLESARSIEYLAKTNGEAVVGAANATRIQNAADAGGVFFSSKTRIRSGKYADEPDPGITAFLNAMLTPQLAPMTIPKQQREQLISFVAIGPHIWPASHSRHNVQSGFDNIGMRSSDFNVDDPSTSPLDFDTMIHNLGDEFIARDFSPEHEATIRAALPLGIEMARATGHVTEAAMTEWGIPLGAVLEHEASDAKQAARPVIDERPVHQERVVWVTAKGSIAQRAEQKIQKAAEVKRLAEAKAAAALKKFDAERQKALLEQARQAEPLPHQVGDDARCCVCVMSWYAAFNLQDEGLRQLFIQCECCRNWYCPSCRPVNFKTSHEARCFVAHGAATPGQEAQESQDRRHGQGQREQEKEDRLHGHEQEKEAPQEEGQEKHLAESRAPPQGLQQHEEAGALLQEEAVAGSTHALCSLFVVTCGTP